MLKSIHYISSHTQQKSKSKLGSKLQTVFEYGNVRLTWFEEIFEEYYISKGRSKLTPTCQHCLKKIDFYSGSTKILICDLS